MKLYKRDENYKNPIKTTKINFLVLGILYIILGIFFFPTKIIIAYTLIPLGVLLLVAAYFLNKKSIYGVYVGWVFIILGTVAVFLNSQYSSILLIAYISFWNYKASKVFKIHSSLKGSTVSGD